MDVLVGVTVGVGVEVDVAGSVAAFVDSLVGVGDGFEQAWNISMKTQTVISAYFLFIDPPNRYPGNVSLLSIVGRFHKNTIT